MENQLSLPQPIKEELIEESGEETFQEKSIENSCPENSEVEVPSEDNTDVVDLGGYDEYEWNSLFRKRNIKEFDIGDEEKLENTMQWYIDSLEEVPNFEDKEKVMEFMYSHITSFKATCIKMKGIREETYLEYMEKILAVYVLLELMTAPKKECSNRGVYKLSLQHASIKIIRFLKCHLLDRAPAIEHVFMRMKMDSSINGVKDLLNLIFRTLLVSSEKHVDHSDDLTFCRHYVLFQKWKKIRDPSEWQSMDKLLFTMFDKTVEDIKKSDTLKTIFTPQSGSVIDTLAFLTEDYVSLTENYFNYFKEIRVSLLMNAGDSYNEDSKFQILEKTPMDELCTNLFITFPNTVDLREDGESSDVIIKEEEEEDDCQIVNVEFPKSATTTVNLIHEYIEDDDDICEIIMPDIYEKKNQPSFLESIDITEDNSTENNAVSPAHSDSPQVFLNSLNLASPDIIQDDTIEGHCPTPEKTNNTRRVTFSDNDNTSECHTLVKSSSVVKGILKKPQKNSLPLSLQMLPDNSNIVIKQKEFCTVETQTDMLNVEIEPDKNLMVRTIPISVQTEESFIEPNQSTVDDSMAQVPDDHMESENDSDQVSENDILNNSTEKVDSTASCLVSSVEELPQVSKDLVDENIPQRPDSNQVDSPENSNLSENRVVNDQSSESAKKADRPSIDSTLFPSSPSSSSTKTVSNETYALLASPDISSTSADIQEHTENNSSENQSFIPNKSKRTDSHSEIVIDNDDETSVPGESTLTVNEEKNSKQQQRSVEYNQECSKLTKRKSNSLSCQSEHATQDQSMFTKELKIVLSKDDQASAPNEINSRVMFTSPLKVTTDFTTCGANVHIQWNKFKDTHGLKNLLSGPVTEKVNVSSGSLYLNDSSDWFGDSNKVSPPTAEQPPQPILTSTSPNTSNEITSPAFEEGLDDFRIFFEEKHETLKGNNVLTMKESNSCQKMNKPTSYVSKQLAVKNIKNLQTGKRKRILFASNLVDSDNIRTHSPTEGTNRVLQSILKKTTSGAYSTKSYSDSENASSLITLRRVHMDMDNLIYPSAQNNHSLMKYGLQKVSDEENIQTNSFSGINGDSQGSDAFEKISTDSSSKRPMRPRIPKRLLNMKSLERYGVNPDDVCIQGDPCVVIEKLTEEEISRRLKLSEISRRMRLEKERKNLIPYSISSLVRVDYNKDTTNQINNKDVVRFSSPYPWQVSSSDQWRNVTSPFSDQEEGIVTICNSDLTDNSCDIIHCENKCSCNNIAFDLTKLKVSKRKKKDPFFNRNFTENRNFSSYSYPAFNPFIVQPKRRKKRKHSEESINISIPDFSTSDITESCDNLNSSLNIDLSFVSSIVENFDKESSDFILDINPLHFDKEENSRKDHSEFEDIEKITKTDDLNKIISIPADLHNLNLRKFSPSPVIHCVSPRSNSPNNIIVTEYDSVNEKHIDYNSEIKKLNDFTTEYNLINENIEYVSDLGKENLDNCNHEHEFSNNDSYCGNLNLFSYQICDTITEYGVKNGEQCIDHNTNDFISNNTYEDIKNSNLTNYSLIKEIVKPQINVALDVSDLRNKNLPASEVCLTPKDDLSMLKTDKSEIISDTFGDENANLSFDSTKETTLALYTSHCSLSKVENTSFTTQNTECIDPIEIKTDITYNVPTKEQTDTDKSSKAAHKSEPNVLDSDGIETRLPLKKRKLSVANNKEETEDDDDYLGPDLVEEIIRRARAENVEKEDISYPAKPMISIAEIQEKLSEPQPRIFKTPAEKKEMPPPPVETVKTPKIVTEQYNNHTYNNPTINYHMNNVPYPFFPCASLSYFPSILLPINSTTTFDMNLVQQPMKNQEAPTAQEPTAKPKKERKSKGRKKNI